MNLLKQENLNENELSAIAEEYPYYPVARFKLLSKFKKNKSNDFEKQALITALFFNNTKWLNRQLYYESGVEDGHHESPFTPGQTNSLVEESVPEQAIENNLASPPRKKHSIKKTAATK